MVGDRSWLPVYPLELEPVEGARDLGIQRASLVQGRGELSLLTTSRRLHAWSLGAVMLGSLVILHVIWILRVILVNVLQGRPCAAANGRSLRRAGYLVLTVALVWPGLDWALSDYVLSRIAVTNLDLRPAITLANLSILKTNKARAIRFSTPDALCRELGCQRGDLLEREVAATGTGRLRCRWPGCLASSATAAA